MKFPALILSLILLAFGVGSCGTSPQQKELTASDLVAEHEKLVLINQALHQGQWVINQNDYSTKNPKVLGTYKSRQVAEIFICGDVCPQYGSVIIIYPGIAESDCASISGDAIYSMFWGLQFQGCSPLAVRYGTLAQDGTGAWSIVGESINPQHYNTPLLFDDASLCRKGGTKVACGGLQTGQSAVVVGLNSGNAILVLTLDM